MLCKILFMNNTLKLIIAISIPLAIGLSASFFTVSEIPGWFSQLEKPSWNPPNWLFAPVWTALYIMMGIALFLVWKSTAAAAWKRPALYAFAMQMVLNFLWSFIFFNRHQLAYAFGDIVLLWTFLVLTIFYFQKISAASAFLLVPYLCWVTFAACLNYSIWKLN